MSWHVWPGTVGFSSYCLTPLTVHLYTDMSCAPTCFPVQVGEAVGAQVDYARRALIAPNHTFTHVLNFALKV